MKIVCSSDMPFAREAFGALGETVILDGRAIGPRDARDADILAIRSTTRINRRLLEGSRVRFVGTATIGFDHMDTAYLEKAGIRWRYSPGCNANSVSEYIAAALSCLAARHGFALEGLTVGVVGVGNVGRLVVEKAEALGMRALQNDPPRQRSEVGGQKSAGRGPFVSLDRILDESDVVTLHVPLTKEGPDATFQMADAAFFARLKPGAILINSARGAVVQADALLAAMSRGIVSHAVIDTWEGEPRIRQDLLERADLGTPHIAGYSYEGKVMGTVMVYREACRFLGVEPSWQPDRLLPAPPAPEVRCDAAGLRDEEALWNIARQVYDIEFDDRNLRAPPPDARPGDETERARHFDGLRIHYRIRREFRFTRVRLTAASEPLARKVGGLGFSIV
ncbi:MAG: 4-phosphoerythronate dehydrogenase [Verrucomicrobiota bacterium]|nr:4-phosphoerythronate dehydrogenase [Verrucomicrobiota bacterium]